MSTWDQWPRRRLAQVPHIDDNAFVSTEDVTELANTARRQLIYAASCGARHGTITPEDLLDRAIDGRDRKLRLGRKRLKRLKARTPNQRRNDMRGRVHQSIRYRLADTYDHALITLADGNQLEFTQEANAYTTSDRTEQRFFDESPAFVRSR